MSVSRSDLLASLLGPCTFPCAYVWDIHVPGQTLFQTWIRIPNDKRTPCAYEGVVAVHPLESFGNVLGVLLNSTKPRRPASLGYGVMCRQGE